MKSQDRETGITILLDVVANGRSPFYLVADEVVREVKSAQKDRHTRTYIPSMEEIRFGIGFAVGG